MRTYLLAAAAAAAVAASTPAVARDGSPYLGVEGGLVFDGKAEMDLRADVGDEQFDLDDAIEINFKRGADLDLIAGYDFGLFRAEAELGYKRLRVRDIDFIDDLVEDDEVDDALEEEGRATIWSLMGNALVDFGGNGSFGAYAGGGVGAARGKFQGESGTALAWQLLAGVHMPISSNVDIGLKYRFFNSQKLKFSDSFDDDDFGVVDIEARGKLRTHSLLGSLIFNFGAPPPPPPPLPLPPPPAPPAPPATQTCPDGSVILATDMCPVPPPPPPPPPPEPERG